LPRSWFSTPIAALKALVCSWVASVRRPCTTPSKAARIR
jgi:hypothetical protein